MAVFGNFQTCLEEAWAFIEVGRWCENGKADQLLFGMMYPCAVNYAFSCELLLKAIELRLSPDSLHADGHGLYHLFVKLPEDTKQQIESDAVAQGIDDLLQFLKVHDLSYNEWRYAFEKENVKADISKLSTFADVLYSYAKNNYNQQHN